MRELTADELGLVAGGFDGVGNDPVGGGGSNNPLHAWLRSYLTSRPNPGVAGLSTSNNPPATSELIDQQNIDPPGFDNPFPNDPPPGEDIIVYPPNYPDEGRDPAANFRESLLMRWMSQNGIDPSVFSQGQDAYVVPAVAPIAAWVAALAAVVGAGIAYFALANNFSRDVDGDGAADRSVPVDPSKYYLALSNGFTGQNFFVSNDYREGDDRVSVYVTQHGGSAMLMNVQFLEGGRFHVHADPGFDGNFVDLGTFP
jgi:hypothetical protein